MENRTVRNLSMRDGRVYVYLADEEIMNRFRRQAEREGFTFGDGVRPTMRRISDIVAVNRGGTVNFVGANGRIAFGAGAKRVGDERLTRVDYARYISGDDDYIFKPGGKF